ncbi:MAG: hypothetical protein JNL60_09860 [Bacteroidia bacterium]|nr:hypothetical protein [Bacteroidia bacterium]
MKRNLFITLMLLYSVLLFSQVARDSVYFKPQYRIGQNYSVLTSQGDVYTGYVSEETAEFITLKNRATQEKYELRKNAIVDRKILREAPPMSDLLSFSTNPQPRYYMLSENALLFDAHSLHMNSHWLLMEKFDYAFTKNVGICMSALAFYPYSLGVKAAFQLQKNDYIGGSIFGVGDITSKQQSSWFLGYGALARYTKGNENRNINVSAGFVGINNSFFLTYKSRPYVNMMVLNAGLTNRFRESLAFNAEAWYLPALNIGLGGIALKFMSDEYSCWTLGCFAFLNGKNDGVKLDMKSLPLPYFGVSRKF